MHEYHINHHVENRRKPRAPVTLHTPVATLPPFACLSAKKNPPSLPTAKPSLAPLSSSDDGVAAVVYSSCGSVANEISFRWGLAGETVPGGLCINLANDEVPRRQPPFGFQPVFKGPTCTFCPLNSGSSISSEIAPRDGSPLRILTTCTGYVI